MCLYSVNTLFPNGVNISSATGAPLNITGNIEVDILFPGLIQPVPILVTIRKTSIRTDEMPALIGANALEEWKSALRERHGLKEILRIYSVIVKWKTDEDENVGIVQVNIVIAGIIMWHAHLFLQT